MHGVVENAILPRSGNICQYSCDTINNVSDQNSSCSTSEYFNVLLVVTILLLCTTGYLKPITGSSLHKPASPIFLPNLIILI